MLLLYYNDVIVDVIQKESCPVKLTATVIFREDARIQREEDILHEKCVLCVAVTITCTVTL